MNKKGRNFLGGTVLKMKSKKNINRRELLESAVVSSIAFSVVPRHVLGGRSYVAPSDKITVANIGCGTQGLREMPGMLENPEVQVYTVGLFILLPFQFYFELVTNAGYSGTFWQIIPRYFASFYLPHITSWPESLLPIPFSGHLWFLQYLFLISLMTLPLLLCLKSEWGQRWIERLTGWCNRRGGIFLFVIPLAIALISLRGLFRIQRSWADFLWYAIYFIIGYIIAADKRFAKAFKRHQWVCLALWIIGFFGGGGFFVLVLGYDPIPGNESLSFIYVMYQIVWSIASWSAVVFMLSLGAKYLNFNHKILAYGNEAVLPFYLFHQTIILIVGFFVIRWNIGILPKFLVVTVISFPLILVLYELLVKPFNAVRFFFGMRPGKRIAKKPGPTLA